MKKSLLFSVVLFSFIPIQVTGQTWSSPMRITWNGGDSRFPSIATDSGSGIHVVWEDETPGNIEVFYKHSTDSGAAWSGLKRLTWNTGNSRDPVIAIDSGSGIHVVWEDTTPGYTEIYYKSSSDSGSTWFGPKRLTWNAGHSKHPSIVADSGSGIHVVWENTTPVNTEIYYKSSSDCGVSWSGVARMTWNIGGSMDPSLAVVSVSGIHLVWCDESQGNREIFYKRSTDGGTSWSGLKRLTWNGGWSLYPSIAVDSGSGIHVVWHDNTPGNWEIFYKRSTDGGASWSGLTRLTWNGGNSWLPSVVADSGSGIHVVWYDDTCGNAEIYYKRSSNGGNNWSGPTRLSWNLGLSEAPSVAVDSGSGIHVVWDDHNPGNFEIFYKNRK